MPITDRLTMANQLPSLLPGLERDSAFTKPNSPLTFTDTSAGEESSLLRWKVDKISHYRPPATAAPNGRSPVELGAPDGGWERKRTFPSKNSGLWRSGHGLRLAGETLQPAARRSWKAQGTGGDRPLLPVLWALRPARCWAPSCPLRSGRTGPPHSIWEAV